MRALRRAASLSRGKTVSPSPSMLLERQPSRPASGNRRARQPPALDVNFYPLRRLQTQDGSAATQRLILMRSPGVYQKDTHTALSANTVHMESSASVSHLPRRGLSNRATPLQPERNIFDCDDEDEGEFEQAMQQLHLDNPAGQLAGAKHLSALLKPQTMLEDVPVMLEMLDAAEETRRGLLRIAWSTAMESLEPADDVAGGPSETTHTGAAHPASQSQDETEDAILQSTLSFGDLSFDMVADALAAVDALGVLPRRGGVVSGGNMVDFTARGGQFALAAALLHPFDYVLGVEGSEEKCGLARARLESLQASLSHLVGNDDRLTWEVSFEHSGDESNRDMEQTGLLAADLVAVNCAGLTDYHINDLGEGLLGLRPNAVVISFGRRVPCPGMRLLDTRILTCQWEDFPCYIMQRVSDFHNQHLPPVELPVCTNHPANRESGDLQRAGDAALDRLVYLAGGAAAVAAARGQAVPPLQATYSAASPAAAIAAQVQLDPPADVRQIATMTLSYCAHRESNTRALVGDDYLVVDRVVDMLACSRAASKENVPTLAAAAAAVMLLRALGKHPCALPAIIDTPGSVDALVSLLSFDHLVVAAGAADALSSCLTFVEARAFIVQSGAVKGLQGLKRRASANRQQHAFETAELVLNMLGDAEPESVKAKASPLYEHLKGLGLDKSAPPTKF